MRKALALITLAMCLTLLIGCGKTSNNVDSEFGFKKEDFVILRELDTHGGFLGDGSYYLILDCSESKEKIAEITRDWKSLPLTESLTIAMYGLETEKAVFGPSYNANKEFVALPHIENGCYKFYNRQIGALDPYDDENIHDRFSYNYSIAIYDSDKEKLYYYELDT